MTPVPRNVRTRRVGWVVAVGLWMSVMLSGCSGTDEQYLWPWQDEEPPAPAADFVGMWDYDPAGGYVAAGWQGIIVIEWPCVFMVEDIDDAHSPPRRAAVKMPRHYTRYDPQTQSMWVAAEGPITTGDLLVFQGTGGRPRTQELQSECPANAQFQSGFVNKCPWGQPHWCDDSHMAQIRDTALLAPTAEFAGMWDYDPAAGSVAGGASGLLFIEEPCVYLVEDIYQRHDPSRRVAVALPSYTRYDPQTQSMWVYLDGPFTTGDQVTSRGASTGADSDLAATCPANGQFTATDMNLCSAPPPDRC